MKKVIVWLYMMQIMVQTHMDGHVTLLTLTLLKNGHIILIPNNFKMKKVLVWLYTMQIMVQTHMDGHVTLLTLTLLKNGLFRFEK
jgi:hypothetical protein